MQPTMVVDCRPLRDVGRSGAVAGTAVAAAAAVLLHHYLPLLHHPVVHLRAVHHVALAAEGAEDAHVVCIKTSSVVKWISWRKIPANAQPDARLAVSRIPIPSLPCTYHKRTAKVGGRHSYRHASSTTTKTNWWEQHPGDDDAYAVVVSTQTHCGQRTLEIG